MKLELILPGTIYSTKNYGNVEVVDDLGRINKKHLIKIRFINTNSIKIVELYELKRGNIKDDLACKKLDFDPDFIYSSNNYGNYKIIEDLGFIDNTRYVKIRFLNTGYESIVAYNNARIGNVKDIFKPSVYGVGYIGTNEVLYDNSIDEILYHRWINMISRCYNVNDKKYNSYGGIGVRVDDRWLNFNNYRNDVKLLNGYKLFENDPSRYHLDKDFNQLHIPHDKRIYSINTCIWLDAMSNMQLTNIIAVSPYIIYYNNKYYVKLYDANWCIILDYGPFDDIDSAILFRNNPYKNLCTIVRKI